MVGQTINQTVLDCGASQTVCGTEWYQCYLDSLGDEQLNQITESPSSTVYYVLRLLILGHCKQYFGFKSP